MHASGPAADASRLTSFARSCAPHGDVAVERRLADGGMSNCVYLPNCPRNLFRVRLAENLNRIRYPTGPSFFFPPIQAATMKKVLMMIALLGFPFAAITGCGGHSQGVVEDVQEEDNPMSDDQQEQYQKMMESGQYGSSKPGN